MVNFKKIRRGVKAILSYGLANAGVAVVADSGIDAVNVPDLIGNGLFYTCLGLFDVDVVYPIATRGIGNFTRLLFGRSSDGRITNRARAIGLAGLSALMVANGREIIGCVSDSEKEIVQEYIDSNPEGDAELEGRIQTYVNGLRERGLVRAKGIEDFAIYMKDLKTDEVFVEMNADRQQMGASTLKLAVLVAGFEMIHEGRLTYTNEIKRDMERMICESDNVATNRMINRIGLDYINNFVREQGLSETNVELIPKGGRTLNNKTSARDLGDLLENIYIGRLNGSDEMKRILALDCKKHKDRLVDETCIPIKKRSLEKKGAFVDEVYGKTGFIYGVNGNGGVIEARFLGEDDVHPYVVVVMIEDKEAKADRVMGDDGVWGRAKSKNIRWISEEGFLYEFDKFSQFDSYDCAWNNGVHPK